MPLLPRRLAYAIFGLCTAGKATSFTDGAANTKGGLSGELFGGGLTLALSLPFGLALLAGSTEVTARAAVVILQPQGKPEGGNQL